MLVLEVYQYTTSHDSVVYRLANSISCWLAVDSPKGILVALRELLHGYGWAVSTRVGPLLRTYTSDSHPEYFI